MATDVRFGGLMFISAQHFVIFIGIIETIAGILYTCEHNYPFAIVWYAYGAACFGLACAAG